MIRTIRNSSKSYLDYANKILAELGIHHAYYSPENRGGKVIPGILTYDGSNPKVREFQHKLGWY